MVKVKAFKNYPFDFEEETDIDAEWIERIDRTSYASLKELAGMQHKKRKGGMPFPVSII